MSKVYKVYVLNKDSEPLMPTTRFGHVRYLLKTKQAEVVKLELKPHHLVWEDIIANNIKGNPKEGIYAILSQLPTT